ncbi:MBL fold metallo-hydrolase [Natranaerobius thermophilus]|uniref:Beta-lactamase domain protein n=1 Tax=Natranaerobius thermophilus (strain ATCC BAA-1301 / DSM 18059 / JW/NM-WN-LF) TaxID=457570 RepID=B2A7W9_NATTJ|nr:MBL fold metallo-hydrolase [Natranaerobius thermophilus]ACB84417.1 beta-lactamase domain protein [Natranaerobius thermophilus JW/NM-WN-LF]
MPEEILKDIYRIEVPLPRNPLKAINSYLIKGQERNLLIDTGMNRQECSKALTTALDTLKVDMTKTDLLITHLHADHIGLAFNLAFEDSNIYFNPLDAKILGDNNFWNKNQQLASKNGFPKDLLEEAVKKHPGYKYTPEISKEFTFIQEDEVIEVGDYQLKCIETPGHTPGNICLYDDDKKILFSGDHVLWNITPNISASIDPNGNPLKDYINSLDKVRDLEVELVLPAHRSLFYDLSKRVDQLKLHHQMREKEIEEILHDNKKLTAYQLASLMSWEIKCNSWEDFPLVQKWFATEEALAHLKYMEDKGTIGKKVTESIIHYHLN